ncbi:MAG TPA: hypothetical protein VE869_12230 [Gemmatimonas sp.]|nr:hypothetical protein [Gemmatimonas sp.]
MLASLELWLQPWAGYVADHQALAVTILAIHVLAMFTAGGLAVTTDRRMLAVNPSALLADASVRRATVGEVGGTHAVVIAALALTISSGLLLLGADLATFTASRVYWAKMTSLGVLLLNGLRLRRAEGQLLRAGEQQDRLIARSVRALRQSAGVSLALWFIIVLLGVILGNS